MASTRAVPGCRTEASNIVRAISRLRHDVAPSVPVERQPAERQVEFRDLDRAFPGAIRSG